MENCFFEVNETLINLWEEMIFNKLDCEEYEEGLKLLEMYELFCNTHGGDKYFNDLFVNNT
jgi:hypothetical protein